jgi:hypothetical protein
MSQIVVLESPTRPDFFRLFLGQIFNFTFLVRPVSRLDHRNLRIKFKLLKLNQKIGEVWKYCYVR